MELYGFTLSDNTVIDIEKCAIPADCVWVTNGTTSTLKTAEKAFSEADGTIVLTQDLDSPILVSKKITLDLNGKDINPNSSAAYAIGIHILILGGDNWKRLERWRHWKDIVWQYEIGTYPRNGEIPISSTMIREMLAQGADISPFVPKAVVRRYCTACHP